MQILTQNRIGGTQRFFSLSFGQDALKSYYTTNFSLIQHHKYSLTELENMLPWERDIYVNLLAAYIKEQNDKIKLENQANRNRR